MDKPLPSQPPRQTLKAHAGAVNCIRYSSDGQYCLSAGQDKLAVLWNPLTGKRIKEYSGHGWEVLGLCV
jgi:mitogen-activated protein kinase organizer 1